MIKSITVTNYLGESLKIELARPDLSGFVVQSITGLGPGKATINTTEVSTSDGGLFNSARMSKRNIVISLRYYYGSDMTIEELRHLSYKYFPIKRKITLYIETDARTAEIEGYVEVNDPDIFSKNEGADISIICPDPYFYSAGESNVTEFSGVETLFEFPFENDITSDALGPSPGEDYVHIVRYSQYSDGSNMTEQQNTNSKYIGEAYVPRNVIDHENLALDTVNIGKNFAVSQQTNTGWNIEVAEINFDGINGVQIKPMVRGTGWAYGYYPKEKLNKKKIENAGQLTISMDVQLQNGKLGTLSYMRTNGVDMMYSWTGTADIPIKSTSYFKSTANRIEGVASHVDQLVYFGSGGGWLTTVGNITKIKNLKIEEGTVATPWTPAPTDSLVWKPIPSIDSEIIFGEIQNRKETRILYEGDSEVGVIIRIHSIGTATNITIHNVGTRESMRLDTDKIAVMTGSGIVAGDDITICTIKGKKSVTLLRQGQEINILNCLDRNSDWLQLSKGDNIFAYTADTGDSNLQFSVENRIMYEGV